MPDQIQPLTIQVQRADGTWAERPFGHCTANYVLALVEKHGVERVRVTGGNADMRARHFGGPPKLRLTREGGVNKTAITFDAASGTFGLLSDEPDADLWLF